MWTQPAAPKTEGVPQTHLPVPAVPGRMNEERRAQNWVGKSVVIKGELSSAEDMTLDGHVEGSISVREHNLTIGPDADIRADIIGKIVSIRGRVKGQITASDQIQLHETASVEGNVRSPRFVMADGARLMGRVDTVKPAGNAQVK